MCIYIYLQLNKYVYIYIYICTYPSHSLALSLSLSLSRSFSLFLSLSLWPSCLEPLHGNIKDQKLEGIQHRVNIPIPTCFFFMTGAARWKTQDTVSFLRPRERSFHLLAVLAVLAVVCWDELLQNHRPTQQKHFN